MNGINNFKKTKSVKIGIPCADLPDAMLTHENRRVRVMEDVSGEMRVFGNDAISYFGMPFSRHQKIKTRRGDQGCDKRPSLGDRPRPFHHSWVGRDSKELINDGPSRIPNIGTGTLVLNPVTASQMKRGISIGSVHDTLVSTTSTTALPWPGIAHPDPRRQQVRRHCKMSEAGKAASFFYGFGTAF